MKSIKTKFCLLLLICCSLPLISKTQTLQRIPFKSTVDQSEREFLIYLPKGYSDQPNRKWPVILFLHGNGERGDGTSELDFVMVHGPLYEAWIQKRELPFIIIGPQLPMFGRDAYSDYLSDRTIDQLPRQLTTGTPDREEKWGSELPMNGSAAESNYPFQDLGPPMGWEQLEDDLLNMMDHVHQNYQSDKKRVYLTGLSYGGFGTWYMGSKYPDLFAAINPVVGWGHTDLMKSLAESKMPIWCFAGGRDQAVPVKYFYPGLNELERLGHKVRFTIESDMGHDTWKRVYEGEDIYNWFLLFSK
ncbi:MAG: prolyl oligopeptidase family serine peptidase [Reichenbachiella sp.]|uniref:carboxylesterase family protein n=1 Tax=Reichenbachiella sp. TaxID=2184521 RepID=UPI003267CE7E